MYPASIANLFHVPTSYVASSEFEHIKACLKETYDTASWSDHNLTNAIKRGIIAYLLLDTVEYTDDGLEFHSDSEILINKGWSDDIFLSDTHSREIIIDYAVRLLNLKRKTVNDSDGEDDDTGDWDDTRDLEYHKDSEWQWDSEEESDESNDDQSEGDCEAYDASEKVAPEVKAEIERCQAEPLPIANPFSQYAYARVVPSFAHMMPNKIDIVITPNREHDVIQVEKAAPQKKLKKPAAVQAVPKEKPAAKKKSVAPAKAKKPAAKKKVAKAKKTVAKDE